MNVRELIEKLREVASSLEDFVNVLEPASAQVTVEVPRDEKGLGKTLLSMSGAYPSHEDFISKWTEKPYRWSAKPVNKKQEEGRMKRKYTKLHWTKRPENKAKLAKIIKKMQAAKKAK